MPAKKAAAQPRSVNVTKLCEELALGRHDDRLQDLAEAVGHRIVSRGAKLRWRITVALPDVGTLVVDEDNVTLDEMETAERLAGCTWLTLDPRQSARKMRSVLTAAVMHRCDRSEAEAVEVLAGLGALEVVKALSEYLADADPFPSAGSPS
jgi:hypothetical protein